MNTALPTSTAAALAPPVLPAALADWVTRTIESRATAQDRTDGHGDRDGRHAAAVAEAAAVLPSGWPPEGLAAGLAMLDALERERIAQFLDHGHPDVARIRATHEVFAQARAALASRVAAPAPASADAEAFQLQRALAARDRQLSIATHELRTPISSILLNLQILERTARKRGLLDADTITQLLSVPSRQLRRLTRMVDLLLDAAQVENERLVLHRQAVDLCQVVHDVIARLAETARAAGCVLDLEHCRPTTGQWDRVRIEQVITNLVTNAIKYGGGRVDVRAGRDAQGAFVAVRDNGDGIADEDRDRIFEPFERLPATAGEDGAGLGLYIVREIVRAHGGAITVESAPGEGATFLVRLPD